MDRPDLPLADDTAELKREAQKAVDREIAARVELAAAIENRVSVRALIGAGSAAALAFIDAYTNPTVANPEPIAPEVAAPPVDVEPPVYTDVTDIEVNPGNTSGGDASIDGDFDFIPPSEYYPPLPTEPTADSVADPAGSAAQGASPPEDPPVGTAVSQVDGSTT